MNGKWPECPSLRYLIYWGLRRETLCDPSLCADRNEGEERCGDCPLTRLDNAQAYTPAGQLLRRALRKLQAIKLGVTVTLDDIQADEMDAMLMIERERDCLDEERRKRDE